MVDNIKFKKTEPILKTGFTLIELLVVIAIIGLLSTLAIVALGTARLKSRDARRVADLKQIQTALELFMNDNGFYPASTSIQLGDTNHACLNSSGFGTAGCSSPYMATIPKDPKNGYYFYTGSGNTYNVSASLEGTINNISGPIAVTPNSGVSAASQIALNIPFNSPGCYLSGSQMGTNNEPVTVVRNTSSTYVDGAGNVQTCAPNALRVTPSGALIEPLATNLLLRSEALATGPWTSANGGVVAPTLTNNTTDLVAPNGTQTATKIVLPAVSAGQYSVVYQSLTATAVQHSETLYLRTASGAATVYLYLFTGGTSYGQSCSVNTTWTRCMMPPQTLTVGTWTMSVGVDLTVAGTSAQGAQTVYAWGAQLETGPVATSYIPTVAASASRSADMVSVANPLSGNPSGWCMVGSGDTIWGASGGYRTLAALGTAGSNTANTAAFYATESTGAMVSLYLFDGVGGGHTTGAWTHGFISGSQHRLAYCYAPGATTLLVDGVQRALTMSGGGNGIMTGQPSTIYLGGSNATPVESLNGTISNFLVCNTGTYGQGGCQ